MKRLLSLILLCVTALCLVGAVMLFSASVWDANSSRFHAHLIWLGIGSVAAIAVSRVDYRALQKFHVPKILLGIAWLMLAAVLIPGIGALVNGARRWLVIGGQPSEFAKLALVIGLADYGASNQTRMRQTKAGFLIPLGMVGLTAALILVEQDWGTTALLLMVSFALMLVGGTRWSLILGACAGGVAAFTVMVLFNPLRLARMTSFLDPERYQNGVGWQGWHSVLSIGLGGILGPHFGEGSHKYGFVPEQQTDFIFSLIGEELGLVGTTFVLIMFAVFTICGTRIAWRITDPFGQLLLLGLNFLIGLQAIINIGVCTSTLPNKGIPLPFVSYGGSSLVCMLMAVGLIASIARNASTAPVYPPTKTAPKETNLFGSKPNGIALGIHRELPSLIPPNEQPVSRKVLAWFKKFRPSKRVQPPLRSYQKCVVRSDSRNPFAQTAAGNRGKPKAPG